MPTLNFTIDSALLKELGERLVGKPHIALAELVKNSYDADASAVTIRFDPVSDRIEVRDDGHGMDFGEFRDFWMRIGTPHKEENRLSKSLQRPMTGSKGVGRLAVQFLARCLNIITVPEGGRGRWLEAKVDWEEAVHAGDLTKATVAYNVRATKPPFTKGTSIVLSVLKHEWEQESIRALSRELWWLQPPFRSLRKSRIDVRNRFEIKFVSSQHDYEETFDKQIRAIMGIWTARVVGKNDHGIVTLSLEFAGEQPNISEYRISDFPHNAGIFNEKKNLCAGQFEIRIFKLSQRQPHGIRVDEAREYFKKFGGVHVYDGGFRLPYYGIPENDWLRIEITHSHRKFISELLPIEFQESLAHTQRLRYLPTLERVFGVVNVDTAREGNLDIMITRDRLAESDAYSDLVSMVRYALDLYAYEEARRQYNTFLTAAEVEETSVMFERAEQVLEDYESEIPEKIYRSLHDRIKEATTTATKSQEKILEQMGIIGPLATAGISALAYQHELKKQFSTVEGFIEKVGAIRTTDPVLRKTLRSLKEDLFNWLKRAKSTNSLFDYMADAENTRDRRRYGARFVIEDVTRQTAFLARGIEIDAHEIADGILLPPASLAEWGAIFQNIFTNAFNAMLDADERLLKLSSRIDGLSREILVHDTGRGLDLKDAERLFEPFERRIETSPERRALGYGGSGLGLTIVRLIATRIGCRVRFIEPGPGFSTTFSMSWREVN